MGQMKQYKQLIKELPSKTVVFAFGRFNPPTNGHELLMNVVQRLAQQKRADHVVFASKSQDAKKNPLSIEKKIRYLKLMFPRVNFRAADDDLRTFIEACVALHNMGYKNVVMVAGSDRYQNFNTTLNKYNGKKDRHGFYKFDTIEVISSGQRDPDDDNSPAGMSGTKMREHAKAGKFEEFKKGLPKTMREIDARRLMNDVRQGMGLQAVREQIELPKDDIREMYFQEKIFNVGNLVESNEEIYEIVKRGSNHLLLRNNEGNLESKWIHDVKELKMNEELTDKTLRKTDKIKVARMIAMMLGVDKPEASSNAENLVNMGLRKIRTKALNPESVRLVGQIVDLAKHMDIKFDAALLPAKLKEEKTDRVVPVDKTKKNNMAGDILSYKDFKKIDAMKGGYKEEVETKETESDLDADNADAETHTAIGGLMSQPYGIKDDNHRRRVVKYHLGEAEDAAAKAAEKAAKETAKAQLSVKHAKEKEALATKHANDREQLKSEEVEEGKKPGLWDNIHAKRKRIKAGSDERMRKPGSKGAPTADDFKQAAEETVYRNTFEEETVAIGDLVGFANHLQEKLTAADDMGTWIKDFKKSDAPQFKGKSKEKKREMAIAAKLQADDVKEEVVYEEKDDVDVRDYEKDINITDFTDNDIDSIIADLTDDDYLEEYEEDELALVDDETGEEIEADEEEQAMDEEHIVEVLSRAERMKSKFRIRRTKAKRARSTKIALKRFSPSSTINKRARRLAVKALKKRLLRGRNPSKLSVSEKERVEKIIQNKKPLLKRIAMKLAPQVRKREKARMSHSKFTQGKSSVF